MKLSEFKGEEALDILADLIDPAVEIMTDKSVVSLAKSGQKLKAVSQAIKSHKAAVITIMATLEQQEPEEYIKNLNILSLPVKVLEILNDKDLQELFTSQSQKLAEANSGSVSETTEGHEE